MNLMLDLRNLQGSVIVSAISPSNANPISAVEEKKCELFGSFSFIVQFILGILSFMVLVLKRFREQPRRPWKVWFFDVSKQLVSACTIHMMNLFIAILLSINTVKENTKSDECMWYFINLLVDTSLGVFICFALMMLVDKLAKEHKIKDLQSGLYYEKVKKKGKEVIILKPKMYFIQLGIWILIVTVSKLFLLGFTKLFSFYLEIIGKFILKPFTSDEKFELLMVMVVFPLIINAIQFWVLDNILKLPAEEIKKIEGVPEEDLVNDNNEKIEKMEQIRNDDYNEEKIGNDSIHIELDYKIEDNNKHNEEEKEISNKQSEYVPPQQNSIKEVEDPQTPNYDSTRNIQCKEE